MYEQPLTFATSHLADAVDQSEQSIATINQSELSIATLFVHAPMEGVNRQGLPDFRLRYTNILRLQVFAFCY